jgi:phenylpropionate dioxygenase-like ring-hydroxylating dioxygenase large terminal subunit
MIDSSVRRKVELGTMSEPMESALCGALMDVLGAGADDMPAILAGINAGSVRAPGETAWTEESLRAFMRSASPAPVKAPVERTLVADYDPERAALSYDGARAPQRTVEEQTEFLLTYGLRNKWYVVAASAEVTQTPLGVKRLGELMVLWRGTDGVVHAVEDRCPHRGIAMSIGDVRDGRLTCGYHGVQLDEYGKVLSVPALPGCSLEGKKLIKSYPTIEHFQAIWAYFGDDAHPAPPPLVLPDELIAPEWTGTIHTDVWNGDYRYVWDNLVDPMHGPYLHSRTYTQSRGPKSDNVLVEDTGHGFEVFREGQRGVNLDWIEFVNGGTSMYSRVEIPMPPNAGPGGYMGIIFFTTPVDAGVTRINVWRLRKVSGWQRELWHFLFEHRIRGFVNAVLEQDKNALAFMPPWPAPERLYLHDAGVTRLRKFMRESAKEQARELALQPAGYVAKRGKSFSALPRSIA